MDTKLFKTGTTVLVVDDNEMNLEITSSTLEQWNISVKTAEDGKKAIDVLLDSRNSIHLVIMDMQMPVMSGIEATLLIRQFPNDLKDIPIVAMTAAVLPEEKDRCLRAGMNDYIAKPFSPAHLHSILSLYLEIEDSLPNASSLGANKISSSNLYSFDYLMDVSAGNTEFIHQMIQLFFSELSVNIPKMKEFNQSMRFNDLGELAHKSKSMSGYLFAQELTDKLKQVELLSFNAPQKAEILVLLEQIDTLFNLIINDLRQNKHLL
jgi:CheY-like chemotaxis protein